MSNAFKQQLSNVPLTMTVWPSAFLLKDYSMHTPPQLQKGPSNFVWSHHISWKIQSNTATISQGDTLHGKYDV